MVGPAAKREAVAHLQAELDGMVLYRDAQVIVLNKPYGLPVQGGPGITRHLDGMLDLFEVFLQIRRCAEEQFPFEAVNQDSGAGDIIRHALANHALGRQNQLRQMHPRRTGNIQHEREKHPDQHTEFNGNGHR